MLSAIVTAAGRSERMGVPKGLLTWEGMPLLEYQLQQLLRGGVKDVVVVLGYRPESYISITEMYPVKTVINDRYDCGRSTSIIAGLQALASDSDAVFVVSVDQPVTSKTIFLLSEEFRRTGKPILVPVFQERRGHPPLLSSSIYHDLAKINEETNGLRQLMTDYYIDVGTVNVADRSVLSNFNTLDDYLAEKGMNHENI